MNTFRFTLGALVLCLACSAFAQNPLTRDKVRLLKHIPLSGLPPVGSAPGSGSGCVGYISPSGREYAIMGQSNGNSVIEITNPTSPTIIGHIPGRVSQWHEVCVMGAYAYASTEAGGGVQVIDLRQVDSGIVSLLTTITTNDLSRGHTVQAIPSSNLLVVNGGDLSGLRVYDCQNPSAPVLVGQWATTYVHDSLFVKYDSGPYAGKEVGFLFAGGGTLGGVYIVDFTTTVNSNGNRVPALTNLGSVKYFPTSTNFYCHSGAISADRRFLYVNDEFDEANSLVADAATHIIDVQNLQAPFYVKSFVNPLNAIDHNSMVQDDHLMLAAYKQGLRIYSLNNPTELAETGFIDTFVGSGKQFQGAWGTWAGFPSGNVIISDINAGFLVVDPSEAKGWGAPILGTNLARLEPVTDADKKLRRADDLAVTTRCTSKGGSLTVNLKTDALITSKVDVKVRIKAHDRPEKVAVYAMQNNGTFKLIGQGRIGTSYTEMSFPNLNGATYVQADKSIQLRVDLMAGKVSQYIDIDLVRAVVHQ